MRLPFQQADPYRQQMDEETRQMNYAREQAGVSVAEQIPDQVMMQQQEERTDLLKWQQDLDDELENLTHDLRNEVFEDGEWKRQGPPIMNEKGVRKIQSLVRPFLSRNMFNTNFPEERVLGMLHDTSNALALDLALHYHEYNLSFSNCPLVTRWVKNVIMAGPHRAMDGWNKRLDTTISKRVEAFSEGGNKDQTKKRLFGLFG